MVKQKNIMETRTEKPAAGFTGTLEDHSGYVMEMIDASEMSIKPRRGKGV
jgi:hypothetical protein